LNASRDNLTELPRAKLGGGPDHHSANRLDMIFGPVVTSLRKKESLEIFGKFMEIPSTLTKDDPLVEIGTVAFLHIGLTATISILRQFTFDLDGE